MVSTVRENKPELPPALLFLLLPKKNKNVILLSPLHRDGSISDRDDRKPIIIMGYNRNKRSVDNLDIILCNLETDQSDLDDSQEPQEKSVPGTARKVTCSSTH
ncbi:unnamed protein product [Lepeophtheirus salmonis]|uniref:(salmon louse) hypothetical protein n=1 Tax=Lepeophtheirus salmonis TaxID=72036 RepID=A0A7R8CSG5_LEPSM|nr:unnamed protein product [Lepeophtheirus salmonis]CAF2913844.1 unnamed protein product [Lepeophtheirus salmonis]